MIIHTISNDVKKMARHSEIMMRMSLAPVGYSSLRTACTPCIGTVVFTPLSLSGSGVFDGLSVSCGPFLVDGRISSISDNLFGKN